MCLDGKGRSVFADLMQRTHTPYFYAFDLVWLDGEDLRLQPLLVRKQHLLRLIERRKGRLLYVDHLVEGGRALFEVACGWDLEGIVAKRKDSRYVATRSKAWLKVKNPHYSQAVGRQELFESWRSCSTVAVE